MMNDLLSQEVIDQILSETGAMGESRQSHLVTSVSHFRPFQIERKAQAEFNLAFFDRALQRIPEILQKDWNKNFVDSCLVSRRETGVMSLSKYRFREQAICVSLSNEIVPEPFLCYFDAETFFFMMNQYFGGGNLPFEKNTNDLTKIEEDVMKRVCQSFCDAFRASFQMYLPIKLEVGKVDFSAHEQDDLARYDYLILDMSLHSGEERRPLAFAIPMGFLKAVRKKLEKMEREHRVADPHWQKILSDAVMSSDVELQVNVAKIDIPFEKSFNLKPGDVFPLESCGPRVTLSVLGRPQMTGKIGAVGENYAVQIEEN